MFGGWPACDSSQTSADARNSRWRSSPGAQITILLSPLAGSEAVHLMAEHIMLTSLGTNPTAATYGLNGRQRSSTVAPAALYYLLPEEQRPGRIIVLCTEQAKQVSLPALREALASEPCQIDDFRVSEENTPDAVHQFLATLAESVPPNVDLTVDVTQGFRHQAFLTYTGVLYLTALQGVRLRNAFYGMLAQRTPRRRPTPEDDSAQAGQVEAPEPSPFLDIQPLVDLPQWFHALRILRDTGSAHAIAELVKGSDPTADHVRDALRTLAEAHASGLPIELGYLAGQFLDQHVEDLRALLHAQRLPLADRLVQDLATALEVLRLAQRDLPEADWKSRVSLTQDELVRQARIIDSFLDRRDYATAFGLMREWLVLWDMWRTNRAGVWLRYKHRRPNEDRLHVLKSLAHNEGALGPEETVVGRLWEDLAELRNAYQHQAIDREVRLTVDPAHARRIDAVTQAWPVLRGVPEITLDVPVPAGRALISPIGMRPGVLYSALHAAGPDLARVLVICSTATQAAIDATIDAAGYRGEVVRLALSDPFAGVEELDALVGLANRYLANAGTVLVNITGGTTLMGVLAERIAGRARRDRSRMVRRFALIDRRSTAEQESDPYRPGQVCWLDGSPTEEA